MEPVGELMHGNLGSIVDEKDGGGDVLGLQRIAPHQAPRRPCLTPASWRTS